MPNDLNQQLRNAVAQWVALSGAQWTSLRAIFRPRRVESREFVALPGAEAHELLFVCQGLLRFYYVDGNGRETNKAFIAENEFAGPLASSALALPLYYGIEALEPTTLLVAPFSAFTALFEQQPVFDRLGRKLAERLLIRKELRTRSLLQQNASDRYRDFVRQHPDLIDRVPQYHIASYLGVTEVSLSRLKRDLNI